MDPTPAEPLTEDEVAALADHEATIRAYGEKGIGAGRALRAVRDDRLYRAAHRTFEAYVAATLDVSVARGYQLIAAADVCDDLDAQGFDRLPGSEAQARPLVQLSSSDRAAVWRYVGDGRLTGAIVRQAVAHFGLGPTPAAPPEPASDDLDTTIEWAPEEEVWATWTIGARRALRAVPKVHRRPLAALVTETIPADDVSATTVAELAEGYTAVVLESAAPPPAVEGGGPATRADVGRPSPGDGEASSVVLVEDLVILPDVPTGPVATPLPHPAAKKNGVLFLGTGVKGPLLVSLPTGLVPSALLGSVRAGPTADEVSRVVVEVSDLERAGGPVDDGVVRLDEVRAYCEAEGVRPVLQRTTESVD